MDSRPLQRNQFRFIGIHHPTTSESRSMRQWELSRCSTANAIILKMEDEMVAHLVRQSARPVLFVAVLAALLLLLAMPAAAINWIDFQAAAGVLGQPGFGTNGTGLPNAFNFTSPRGIAVDPTTGKVFVVDNGHERVLRFSALAAVINGSAAEAVLGQPICVVAAASWKKSG